jgi:hypothetical protein
MRSEAVHEEIYKGLVIKIHADDGGLPCPFDDWDCEPPIAAAHGRDPIMEHATEYGNVNEVPTLTRSQIVENGKDLLDLLGEKSWFRVVDRTDLSWQRDSGSGSIDDLINDAIREHVDYLPNCERLNALADLYNITGMLATCDSVSGYSQGDYGEVLVVLTPDFLASSGAASNTETLKRAVKLYEDWAYGNVYGFTVETADGKDIESVWGFYGDYDAKPYSALEEARDVADYVTRSRWVRFKEWLWAVRYRINQRFV